MSDFASALYSGRIAAPGTPKTTSTPSDSITRTTASITFIFGMGQGSFGRVSGGRAGRRADRVLSEVLDVREQRGVVAVAAAVAAKRLEHLVDRGRVRQRDAILARGLQRDPEVLVVQVHPEAGREVVLAEVAPADVHDLVRGEAAGQDLDDRRGVHAGLRAEDERLGHGFDRERDDDLVACLDDLARADGSDVHDRLAERLEERLRAREVLLAAAGHDRQRRLAGADVAAGDGRVDPADAALAARLRDLARDDRRDRAHVDHERALTRAGHEAVVAVEDLAHL